jgi:hypothetical protein
MRCSTVLTDSYISLQTLGGRDHELRSSEHLPGIDPAGPYPAVNHADTIPPARYTSTMGNEGSPHVAMVSIHFISLHAPFADGGAGAEGSWTTSGEPKPMST